MIIQAKCKGFICTNAHPKGCELNVKRQIDLVEPVQNSAIKNVLVIGASSGYGLAARISAAFGLRASTLGIFFEKAPSEKRTATAGFYNSAAFTKFAEQENLYCKNINADAFSQECKQKTIEIIKQDLGKIDLVIYSLAAPVRKLADDTLVRSVLKPIGEVYKSKSILLSKDEITEVEIEPATDEEIKATVKVMGGEDWQEWLMALKEAGVLASGAKTLSFTYVGSDTTQPIYWHGSIGKAKADLDEKAKSLRKNGIEARVAVLPAVVTQASSAIPVMPLYISLLFRVLQEQGLEVDIQKILNNLILNGIAKNIDDLNTDDDMRLRMDFEEMSEKTQSQVRKLWSEVTSENLKQISNYEEYKQSFQSLFGFCNKEIDYSQEISQFVEFDYLDLTN